MNKPELEIEVKKLTEEVKELKYNNTFLLKQQKKYVKMAEIIGTELAPYKAMVMRLQEELARLESTLKTQKVIKNEEKIK